MRPNIQKRIDEVVDYLSDGLSRAEIIKIFREKYKLGEPSVDVYVRKAREQAEAIRRQENESKQSDSKTKEVAARVEALITKEQLIEGLVSIFQNETANVKPSDQIAAAKQISTMLGFNEPSKTDVSISGDLKTVIQLFEDQPPLTE